MALKRTVRHEEGLNGHTCQHLKLAEEPQTVALQAAVASRVEELALVEQARFCRISSGPEEAAELLLVSVLEVPRAEEEAVPSFRHRRHSRVEGAGVEEQCACSSLLAPA